MGRIRTIKPEFFTSPDIGALNFHARLTFIGLWTHCDDWGVALYEPRLLRAAVYPLDEDVPTDLVADHLRMLEEQGLIRTWTAEDGRVYLYVCGWTKHQRNERKSRRRLPAPPPEITGACGESVPRSDLSDHASGNGRKNPRPRSEKSAKEQGTGNRYKRQELQGASDKSDLFQPDGRDGGVGNPDSANPSAVAAFVDAARASGYDPAPSWKARVGKAAKVALAAGKPPALVVAAAEVCARRRRVDVFDGVLADLQARAARVAEPASWASIRAVSDAEIVAPWWTLPAGPEREAAMCEFADSVLGAAPAAASAPKASRLRHLSRPERRELGGGGIE